MLKLLPKNSNYHSPVLVQEAINWLDIKPESHYIDATLGGGGHTAQILQRQGRVLGLDQDPDAISACLALYSLAVQDRQLVLVQANFTHLTEVVARNNWSPVMGILFDLGVSSHQVKTAARGFSWQLAGPLDMRMDKGVTAQVTAADIINKFPLQQLSKLLTDFGEIPVAKVLAQQITAARPITTTEHLAKVVGKWSQQVFQALRIAVNDELGALNQVLPQALTVLDAKGRLVMISFHSLEDRIVKQQFKAWQDQGLGQVLTDKPILGERESKLRAFEKSNEKNSFANNYTQR